MATVQLTAADTAAQTVTVNCANYPRVMLIATGLAGAETATVNIVHPDGSVTPVVNDANVAAVLTVALPTVILAGGPNYQFAKGVTAGAGFLSLVPITHPGS